MKSSLFLFLILLMFPFSCLSSHERFKNLSIDDGLAHTDVNCILQDSTGLLWIGTYDGLQSYDGYRLKTFNYYTQEYKIYQSHNRILSMACCKDKLWIGTESGLTVFDLNTQRYIPYHNQQMDGNRFSLDLKISKIFVDNTEKYLWVKTNQGLSAMTVSADTIAVLHWNSETERIFCKSLNQFVSNNETVWASNGRCITQLNISGGRIQLQNTVFINELFLTNETVRGLYFANNHLYVRTERGCYKLSVSEENTIQKIVGYVKFSTIGFEMPQSTKGNFIVSNDETLWCAYPEGVLEIKNPFSSTHPFAYQHLKNSRGESRSAWKIAQMMMDKYNNLWVATSSWGLFYKNLSRNSFQELSELDFGNMGFLQNEVVSVTGQPNGPLWMIVEKVNLLRYVPQTKQLSLIQLPQDANDPAYYQILQMSRNGEHLYIGTVKNVLIYNIKSQKLTQLFSSNLGSKRINASIANIAEDDMGRLWIATWGHGLFCVEHPLTNPLLKIVINPQTDPALLSSQILQIFIRGKFIYLCTTRGLNRIEITSKGEIKHVSAYQADETKQMSMSSNYLASIDCPNDSVCWIGTIGGGLNKVVLHSEKDNDYSATCYTTVHGLPSNDCEIVMVDSVGNVWVGGNGIVQFDTKQERIIPYGFADGLYNKAFKVNVSYKDVNGTFYMGGIQGLSYFNPQRLNRVPTNNDLMLANLSINNQSIVPGNVYDGTTILDQIINRTSQLMLNHWQNNFTISVAALGYNVSDQIMYRYRLKGLNNNWQFITHTDPEIRFSNLPYRSYLLEVQLSTDKGYTWNEPIKKLTIVIRPPWYQSTWFIVLCIILCIGGAVHMIRQYIKEQNLKKENEIQKVLIAKDEEIYQTKMQFFMNASHELKTPLTLILLAVERLTNKCKPEKEFNTITNNAKKMLALIGELVDIRKQDLGIASLNLESTNCSQLICQLFQETCLWAENKHIDITYSTDDAPIVMDADPDKMSKLVINLFSNAIKYTNEGGKIEISLKQGRTEDIHPCYATSHVEGEVPSDSFLCLLTVKDTGIGISTESIRFIYERFFQVQEKTQQHLGTGIGLAIVKSIVLQHQGMIVVSSERNVGTEFIVALPITNHLMNQSSYQTHAFEVKNFIEDNEFQYEVSPMKLPKNEDSHPELPTLLIVEDNIELQTTMQEHFSASYNVLTADNGLSGLECCMSAFPDIIICDVMMPEMDGIEMCKRIKNNFSVAYIPLVLLTAKGDVENQIEGYESGADLYISKPFSMKLLEVNLRRLLEQREKYFKNVPHTSPSQPVAEAEQAISTEQPMMTTGNEGRESMTDSAEFLRMTEKLKNFIAENLSDSNLSPEQLANALGMSRSKLYNTIRQIDGQNFSDYIRNVRLEKTAQLLTCTNLSVQEIMYEVGFVNSSHFTKIFRLRFGITPTEYKRTHK